MYILTLPVVSWVVCGTIRFVDNFFRSGPPSAFTQIGHGGFPSNHTSIVSSVMWMLAFSSELYIAGLAVAVLMIHVFDAVGLRREVERHAIATNQLMGSQLRERIGHTPRDVVGGLLIGLGVAVCYSLLGVQ